MNGNFEKKEIGLRKRTQNQVAAETYRTKKKCVALQTRGYI